MTKPMLYKIVKVYQTEHAAQMGALDLGLFLTSKYDANPPTIHVHQATDESEWYVKVPAKDWAKVKKWKVKR